MGPHRGMLGRARRAFGGVEIGGVGKQRAHPGAGRWLDVEHRDSGDRLVPIFPIGGGRRRGEGGEGKGGEQQRKTTNHGRGLRRYRGAVVTFRGARRWEEKDRSEEHTSELKSL